MQARTPTTPFRSRHRSGASRGLVRSLAIALVGLLAAAWLTGTAAASPAEGDPTEHFNWTELDYKGKDAAGGELDKGEEPMSPPMILMLLNFGVVLFIIGWKVRPPVMRYVRNRHESIKSALEEASRLREEAKSKLDEYNEKMAAAEAEVEDLIKGIRADAEAEKERIIADAEAQAEALKREAEARIAASIEQARLELEREVTAVALAAAEKIIREKATTDDQTKLVDTFIRDVQADAGASTQERT